MYTNWSPTIIVVFISNPQIPYNSFMKCFCIFSLQEHQSWQTGSMVGTFWKKEKLFFLIRCNQSCNVSSFMSSSDLITGWHIAQPFACLLRSIPWCSMGLTPRKIGVLDFDFFGLSDVVNLWMVKPWIAQDMYSPLPMCTRTCVLVKTLNQWMPCTHQKLTQNS